MAFDLLYNKYQSSKTSFLDWSKIELIDNDFVYKYDNLNNPTNTLINDKIAILKLNGGLGTSMNCIGPKSLLEAKDGYTFLDIIINQTTKPLILMNSFNTDMETIKYLSEKYPSHKIKLFNQSKHPRILSSTNQPLDINNKNHCAPPGHGDLLISLYNSGLLDDLINDGIEYVFISNIDNLGAYYDEKLFNDIYTNNIDFAIELTQKTLLDNKGGTLIKYNHKYMMFEIAQCPEEYLDEFKNINKFRYFNTNNIWIKLKSIKQLIIDQPNFIEDVNLIINKKTLNDGQECIQLEYAIGGMIKFFDKIKCYDVPRERFLPVKTHDNLNLIKTSDYELTSEWKLKK